MLLTIVQYVLVLTVTLGVLVAFHEFGHFIVARWCGVKVLEFSIGFGPRVFSFKGKRDTLFSLAILPLGGFVKMLDEREGEVESSQLPYAFTQKTVGQRIAIVSAGPIANFILAVIIFWLAFLPGRTALKPEVFSVVAASLVYEAGMRTGDVISSVDGEEVENTQQVMMQLMHRLGDTGVIELGFANAATIDVPVQTWLGAEEGEVDILGSLGFDFYRPFVKPVINQILDKSAASEAGLQIGDELIEADDIAISDWITWVEYIQARPSQLISLVFIRSGAKHQIEIIPKAIEAKGKKIGQIGIGVSWPPMPDDLLIRTEYTLLSAWAPALNSTWQATKFSFSSIKKLISGQLSYKQLSGPISIAKVATQSAQSGIYSYLSLLALLSVSLGVMNLLPIPVLDGGHILFYIVEWIKGSPVPDKIQAKAFQVGLFIILFIMILAFTNDISRL